jgi:hypothetical protein
MAHVESRIMTERERLCEDGEPLFTRTRSVREGEDELRHNIPKIAVEGIGIDGDSEAVIEIYQNGYVVTFDS